MSHRKLDTERSTDSGPKHTHLRADHAPLRDGEIVPVEVEIIPNTGLIRKGHRIRLDIQPYTGVGHGMRHAYDASYHDGAQTRSTRARSTQLRAAAGRAPGEAMT